jgi:hypothetical protein
VTDPIFDNHGVLRQREAFAVALYELWQQGRVPRAWQPPTLTQSSATNPATFHFHIGRRPRSRKPSAPTVKFLGRH